MGSQFTVEIVKRRYDFDRKRLHYDMICDITTILPLLADHVLRESNHDTRLLRQFG